jgi:proteasome accessory factor A
MTKDRDLKSHVRSRMAKTGESYTSARAHLVKPERADSDQRLDRIIGIETRYSVPPLSLGAGRVLEPGEVSRYLFRKVVSWGRSSNVYMANGARLYLLTNDAVEYATPECDTLSDLLAHVRAGRRILEQLINGAQERLATEGMSASVYLDRIDHSSPSDESYLVRSTVNLPRLVERMVPFLVSRQILCGAGGIVSAYPHQAPSRPDASFVISPQAKNIRQVLGQNGSSLPMARIGTPYADPERWARLEIRVGDNVGDYATFLKVGTTHLVLRALETDPNAGVALALENPIRALHEISDDTTVRRAVPTANGRSLTAIAIQREFLALAAAIVERAGGSDEERQILTAWESTLSALERDSQVLTTELDWVAKKNLLQEQETEIDSPQAAELDRSFHRLGEQESTAPGHARARLKTLVPRQSEEEALRLPPSTTRARLRGEFISAAKDFRRDYTVDWTHLKLNDEANRTIVCGDPFKSTDERVAKLVALIGTN